MTGFPGWLKKTVGWSVESLWTTINDELASEGMIAAATFPDGAKKYTNGLVNGHAYALVGAYKLSNGVRLVKLSNPWGYDVYKGTWSDKSILWTQALRDEVGSVDNDQDGVFFQTLENFFTDFNNIFFNKNLSGWKYSYWLNKGRDIASIGGT
jgi:hypothetical protein